VISGHQRSAFWSHFIQQPPPVVLFLHTVEANVQHLQQMIEWFWSGSD
jgi:hypothetical protein